MVNSLKGTDVLSEVIPYKKRIFILLNEYKTDKNDV